MTTTPAIRHSIDARKEEYLEMLFRQLRQPSISTHAERIVAEDANMLLIYGHYDVQPPDLSYNENIRVDDFFKAIMASSLVFQRVADAEPQDFVQEQQ